MERIVVGVNEEPAAAAALRWAAGEAAATGRPLAAVLCWTYAGRHGPGGPGPSDPPDPGRTPSPALRRIVEEALGPGAAGVEAMDVPGFPAAGLLGQVTPEDLLVVGAGGTRLVRGFLAGSVSQEVVHRARCPVVVVHEPSPSAVPDGPIVVGVDGSPASDSALRWARCEGAARGAPVEVLHAVDDDPADVLVAASRRARLLVVGSHGMGNLSGLVLGSVAHRVSHLSACPAVLVPASTMTKGPSDAPTEGGW